MNKGITTMDIKESKPIKIVSRFTHKEMDDITTVKEYMGYTGINNAYFLEIMAKALYNKLSAGDDLCDILNINYQ